MLEKLAGDDFGEVPNEDELTRRWRIVENAFGEGVGGPAGIGDLAPAQKWQLICVYDQQQARQRAEQGAGLDDDDRGGGMFASMLSDDDDLQHFLLSPARWLDRLRDQHAGQLPLSVAGDLKLQLKASSGAWLSEFYELGGLRLLVERLADLASMDTRRDHELLLQSELLKCLKAAVNHRVGIEAMTCDPALVPALALNLSSEDVYVATQVLELLAVIMVDGRDGHRSILDAMDYFKLVRGERVRFASLVQVLWDDAVDLSFKRDVLLFLNTIINSSLDVEERIETRSDMVYAGVLDAFEKLKESEEQDLAKRAQEKKAKKDAKARAKKAEAEAGATSGNEEEKGKQEEDEEESDGDDDDDDDDDDDLMSDERYEVEMQMQLFETVMHSDNGDALYSLSTGPGGGSATEVSLAEPAQLFEALRSTATEFDCGPFFLSTLQHLMLIPAYDQLGKHMWARVESLVHATVLPPEEHASEVTLENMRSMLGWKERLEELSQDAAEKASTAENLSGAVGRLESKLSEAKAVAAAQRTALEMSQAQRKVQVETLEKELKSRGLAVPVCPPPPGNGTSADSVDQFIASLNQGGDGGASVDGMFGKEGVAAAAAAAAMSSGGEEVGELRREVAKLRETLAAYEAGGKKIGDSEVEDGDEVQPEPPVVLLKDDPKLGKYFKMLSMHLPKPAVLMKMQADGIDPKILDMDPDQPSPNQPPKLEKKKKLKKPKPLLLLKDDPKLGKYFKMLSMHLPKPAVLMKMKADRIDSKILDMDPDQPSPNQPSSDDEDERTDPGVETTTVAAVTLKDDPKYAKYFKMLSMHLPKPAVSMKMKADGIDPKILEMDPEGPSPNQPHGNKTVNPETDEPRVVVILKDDPKYAKYFKMLSMHLPKPAVAMKMSVEALDPKILDMDPEGPSPSSGDSGCAGSGGAGANHIFKTVAAAPHSQVPVVLLGDDPKYAAYFKLLREGKPPGEVAATMQQDGLGKKVYVLELDPNQPTISPPPPQRTGGGFAIPPPPPKYPKKLSQAPPVPMRALFWQRIVGEELEETVWCSLSDRGIELDLDALVGLFPKDKPKADASPDNKSNAGAEGGDGGEEGLEGSDGASAKKKKALADAAAKKKKATQTNLLDPKVLQNVGIALAKFRLPTRDIKNAILAMDDQVLSLDMIRSLHSLRPSSEDRSTLSEFSGDPLGLGRVEQFFLAIMEIPRYDSRLECFIFKLRFWKDADELQKSLDVVRQATLEMLQCKKLFRILEVVLRLGNFLNGGTARGGLYGFKLDALLKLATIKSVDSKLTLMHFLADWCHFNDPPLLTVGSDLEVAGTVAMRHPLTVWSAAFKKVEGKVSLLDTELEASRTAAAGNSLVEGDQFEGAMTNFHAEALKRVEGMQKDFESVEKGFTSMVEKFGEDPASVGCGEFFGDIVAEFLALFSKAHSENERRRAVAEKARKKVEVSAKRAEQKKAKLSALDKLDSAAEKLLKGGGSKQGKGGVRLLRGSSRRGSLSPAAMTGLPANDGSNSGGGDGSNKHLADDIFTRMKNMQQQQKGGRSVGDTEDDTSASEKLKPRTLNQAGGGGGTANPDNGNGNSSGPPSSGMDSSTATTATRKQSGAATERRSTSNAKANAQLEQMMTRLGNGNGERTTSRGGKQQQQQQPPKSSGGGGAPTPPVADGKSASSASAGGGGRGGAKSGGSKKVSTAGTTPVELSSSGGANGNGAGVAARKSTGARPVESL